MHGTRPPASNTLDANAVSAGTKTCAPLNARASGSRAEASVKRENRQQVLGNCIRRAVALRRSCWPLNSPAAGRGTRGIARTAVERTFFCYYKRSNSHRQYSVPNSSRRQILLHHSSYFHLVISSFILLRFIIASFDRISGLERKHSDAC